MMSSLRFFGMKLACALVATGLVFASVPSLAQTSTTIQNILVEGTKRIDPTTIQSYLKVQAGDAFDDDKLNESLKALFTTGLFADVQIKRVADDVIVTVVENPIVNQIAFEGNRRIKDEALASEVQLKPRTVFTRTRIQQDVDRITEIYRRSGRYGVTVAPKVIQQDQNRVDVVFEIEEGKLTPVESINFIGNRRFSDSDLRSVILTKEEAFYRFLSDADKYDPDRLNFDKELLRRHYLENGYADFEVGSAVAELTPDREAFVLTFTVSEGRRYRFGQTSFDIGLPRVTEEELRGFIEYGEGGFYNAPQVDDTADEIDKYLGSLGYAFADVRPKINRDRGDQRIDIVIEVGEAQRAFVDRIDIEGNVRTLDEVIRREMSLVEGDAFNTTKLSRSERRIRNLGFFGSVEVTSEPSDTPDRTRVKVKVTEQSTGQINLGIGFSTQDAVIANASIRETNLLGRGQDLLFSVQGSARSTEFDIKFTEPYFFDRDVAAGFDLFRIDREEQESSFSQLQVGGALRASYELAPDLRQALKYTIRSTKISNVDTDASRFVRDQEGSRLLSAFGQTLTFDRRDNRIDPRDGYLMELSTDAAGAGGDDRFVRASVRAAYHIPIGEDYTIGLLGKAGTIVGLGEDVVISERFFIGGRRFRGFERAGVGPRDNTTGDSLGGNNYYVGTIELGVPTFFPDELGVRAFIFSDIGSVFGVDESGAEVSDESSIRASVGFGMSLNTAVGLIRLDIAEAVLKEVFDEPELLRFSFGTQF